MIPKRRPIKMVMSPKLATQAANHERKDGSKIIRRIYKLYMTEQDGLN